MRKHFLGLAPLFLVTLGQHFIEDVARAVIVAHVDVDLGQIEFGGGFVGAGASALFKGTLGTVISISTPDTLGESLTGFFLSGYFGLSLPAIAVGVALQFISLKATLLAFAIIVSLGIVSALRRLLRAQRPAPSARGGAFSGRSRAADRHPVR